MAAYAHDATFGDRGGEPLRPGRLFSSVERDNGPDYTPRIPARMTALAQRQTFRVAIRVPNNGHSLSVIFPVSPSPIRHFGKEQLGTDFGKAKPACVRERDRGGEFPARRS